MAVAAARREPADWPHRYRALTDTEHTLLVEAGAGSGKTSVMAGRVALLIAGGEDPGAIVAITFTEAAAAELRQRIELFLRDLAAGRVPRDLEGVFARGAPQEIVRGAATGLENFDRLIATTIHGFAQILLRPYPLEADMDPGAAIVDPEIADMAFEDSVEGWMRDLMNGEEQTFVTCLFEQAPAATAAEIRRIAWAMRRSHGLCAPRAQWDEGCVATVKRELERWIETYPEAGAIPNELKPRTAALAELLAACVGAPAEPHTRVAWALTAKLPKELTTKDGEFYAKACNKGHWQAMGKGWGKAEVDARFDAMQRAWTTLESVWSDLKSKAVDVAAHHLTQEVKQALQRYAEWKRAAALLDFDDLLIKARDLLATNDAIRRSLGEKHRRVLVDEFQDTDPLQTEIIWRLCGEPAADPADWRSYRIRPGSLFLVGDPKQAIYRFRGADVKAYLDAKRLLEEGRQGDVLPISVNFRSTSQVLKRVNQVYEPVLRGQGQPGFTILTAHRTEEGPQVATLDVVVTDEFLDQNGKPTAEGLRVVEARAAAEFLQRIIGSLDIPNGEGGTRKATPADIALLCPTGTALWIYETALDAVGISVAPQAGKGFLNRQEVLDLTALARAISDPRDSLALGAFLRGPMLGFADEEILDALTTQQGRKRLSINMPIAELPNGRFRDAMERLQVLRRMATRTTPYQVLSAAIEFFSIRAVLATRHPRSVERSIANLSAFLALSRAWDTRGLKAFADDLRRRREEGARQPEGRADKSADSVSIITMHSAKGLEWPVVVAINLGTLITEQAEPVRTPNGLLFRLLAHDMEGYDIALQSERAELNRERVRLLYVADTRARDLLVVPRHSKENDRFSWLKICKPRLDGLNAYDLAQHDAGLPDDPARPICPETEQEYEAAAARIVEAHKPLRRRAPSRHEEGEQPAVAAEVVAIEDEPLVALDIKGGPKRGLLLHKLLEEILTGELADANVGARAEVLTTEMAVAEIDPDEVAQTVARTLALPEIAGVRARLIPEADVAHLSPAGDELVAGIADAIAVTEAGDIDLVIDWKSDVAPDAPTLAAYRAQMIDYLTSVRCRRGLIVLMTSGITIEVAA